MPDELLVGEHLPGAWVVHWIGEVFHWWHVVVTQCGQGDIMDRGGGLSWGACGEIGGKGSRLHGVVLCVVMGVLER